MREETILSPSQVSGYIKSWMDRDRLLSGLLVRGELSNYKMYPSGHHYFTLKDSQGALRCVMFRGDAASLRFRPENGMQVIAAGRITVFPRDGQYQLYCVRLTPEGAGDLHVAFEQLKEKLLREGLFDQAHKRPLPAYPRRIALITSPAGAAVRDMLRILGARCPLAQVRVLPVRVQGEGAAPSLVDALRRFNEADAADVLIIGRGGGSIEELWAFNEEAVAQAVAASRIPVISAVGHETDFTICDFAADLRAPTPSAAAELAVPDQQQLIRRVAQLEQNARRAVAAGVQDAAKRLEAVRAKRCLSTPLFYVEEQAMRLDYITKAFVSAAQMQTARADRRLAAAASKLDALSPLKVLSRGYAIGYGADGRVVKSTADVAPGDSLDWRLSGGSIRCTVDEVRAQGEDT